jgi:hypothetical protein
MPFALQFQGSPLDPGLPDKLWADITGILVNEVVDGETIIEFKKTICHPEIKRV